MVKTVKKVYVEVKKEPKEVRAAELLNIPDVTPAGSKSSAQKTSFGKRVETYLISSEKRLHKQVHKKFKSRQRGKPKRILHPRRMTIIVDSLTPKSTNIPVVSHLMKSAVEQDRRNFFFRW